MPINEQDIRLTMRHENMVHGSTSHNFKVLFDYIRQHLAFFKRIHCPNIHISSKGEAWDYIKVGNCYVVSKTKLVFDLQRDISATLFNMPAHKRTWIAGFSNKVDLLKALKDSTCEFFYARYNVSGVVSRASNVISDTFLKALESIQDSFRQHNKLLETLAMIKKDLKENQSYKTLGTNVSYLTKLSTAQSIIGQYFAYALNMVKHLGLPKARILTHAKAITYLRRIAPGKRTDLAKHYLIAQIVMRIRESRVPYYRVVNNDDYVEPLTNKSVINSIAIMQRYLKGLPIDLSQTQAFAIE